MAEGDRGLVKGFACGDADYAIPVARWITEWIWEKPLNRRGETIIVLDGDCDDRLAGYGTWTHVEQIGSVLQPKHIEIVWFGVDSHYQGAAFDEAHKVADVVYAEVERFAQEHPDSTPGMPLTLACHVGNDRALAFYKRTGYRLIPDPKLQIEKNLYHRLVR